MKPQDIVRDARAYLADKSYNGDDGGSLMTYREWNIVTCTAIGILSDALSQIQLEVTR